MAAISATRIANMALSHIGAKHQIEDLAEVSPEAKECELWYDDARLQALQAYDWGFARRRIALALHTDTISETDGEPLAGVWAYRYQYPANCVAVRKLQNANSPPDDATPFEVELNLAGTTKSILTDISPAVAVFTFDQEEPSLFSPAFVSTFSHLLGHYIAPGLTGKRSLTRDLLAKYQGLIFAAPALDANEAVAKPPRDAEWVRGRA